MARDIFKRLSAGRPPAEEVTKQPPRRREDPKIFLKDILANGPAPATLVVERGAEHGFTKRQITYAREQMKIIAFKETGKWRPLVLGAAPRQSRLFRRSRQHPILRTFKPPPRKFIGQPGAPEENKENKNLSAHPAAASQPVDCSNDPTTD